MVWFRCDCGTEKLINKNNVIKKVCPTRSCGCLAREMARARQLRHGKDGTRIYRIWGGMRRRCYEVTNKSYDDYGARGIRVCDRWQLFENFYEDMGEPPTIRHSLGRIDNNGHYEPKNCRWETGKQQQRNTRSNRFVTWKGKTKTIMEWSEVLGINAPVLYYRISRGWSPRHAFTLIPHKKNRGDFSS